MSRTKTGWTSWIVIVVMGLVTLTNMVCMLDYAIFGVMPYWVGLIGVGPTAFQASFCAT